MSAPIIAFFNNKGGVGKTSLVYHLSWMYADLGVKVRVGKILEIEIDQEHAAAPDLKQRLEKMCDAMLANPVIEDYEVRGLE